MYTVHPGDDALTSPTCTSKRHHMIHTIHIYYICSTVEVLNNRGVDIFNLQIHSSFRCHDLQTAVCRGKNNLAKRVLGGGDYSKHPRTLHPKKDMRKKPASLNNYSSLDRVERRHYPEKRVPCRPNLFPILEEFFAFYFISLNAVSYRIFFSVFSELCSEFRVCFSL